MCNIIIKNILFIGSGRLLCRRRLCAFVAVAALAGCNDPYSQRRIARRTNHLSQTVADLERREMAGFQRVEEAKKTLEKWWRLDCERFNRNAPTIGDYIW